MNGSSWQRCTVHFPRNVCCHLSKSAQGLFGAAISNIFKQPWLKAAKAAVFKVLALLEKHPRAADVIRSTEADVLAYMSFPEKHWRQLQSTNPLKRQNREIRRRTDVIGVFSNDARILRLVTMLLVEQNDQWAVGRRDFSKASMALLQGAPQPMLEVQA